MRQKSPFGHLSDIFDGFKALGSLQCLSIIKHLPPRQQEIWRCARENLLVPSGLYRDKGRKYRHNRVIFVAKHLMPSHSMRCQMSFLAVGFAAPSGGSAKKRRASLGQPVEETAKHWHEAW